jgi:GTPase
LLHVADASNPAVSQQISAVYAVLQEIGIEEKDTLLLVNKIDQVDSPQRLEALFKRYPNAIPISARQGTGMPQLAMGVSDALSKSFREVEVDTSVSNGRLMAYLAEHGEVISKRFQDVRVTIHCRLPDKYLGRIKDPDTSIRMCRSGQDGGQGSAASAAEPFTGNGRSVGDVA